MPKKNDRRKRGRVVSIIIASVVAVVTLSIIITNFFIPVKYLVSYLTLVNSNAVGEMRISFIDVGYGDCTIVEFPDGKMLVIDGGDGSRSNNLKIFKELNSRGIDTIDYLVCSSVASERCGGLTEILKYKKVENVYAPYCPYTYVTDEYRSFVIEMRERNIEASALEYGKAVINDEEDYAFFVLSPSEISLENGEISDFCKNPSTENINNASAVIWIEYKGVGFLLMGNVGDSVMDKLANTAEMGFEFVNRTVDVSTCSVIKLPNHGARVSNFNRLLKITSPSYAVLSVGKNGYGCPHDFTISDAQNCVGENFYRTDVDGTVTFTVKSEGLLIEKEKK